MEEEFEDTKGEVIRFRKSKNRQHNGQKKKVQKNKQRSTKHTYKTFSRKGRMTLMIKNNYLPPPSKKQSNKQTKQNKSV
jgi:hypothetical protein